MTAGSSTGRLSGQTAVVTGAGRGIGRAIAERYATEGASVVVAARSQSELDATVTAIEEAGGRAAAVKVDITDETQVSALATQAEEAVGDIDVLVNNAGVHVAGRFEEIPPEAWQRAFDVNVHGTVRVTRAFLGGMLARKRGRVINVSSTAGKYGSLYQSPYNASKHAIVGLTRCLALETAQHGVRVNAICPGFVETGLIGGISEEFGRLLEVSPDEVPGVLAARIPIGRFVEPGEVAELAVYLASPAADAMTGQALTLSGGLVLV